MSTPDTLIQRLENTAHSNPEHPALVSEKIQINYWHLCRIIEAQATLLSSRGITQSSIVGIKCYAEIEHVILTLASAYLGASSCIIPTYESKEYQQEMLEMSSVSHLVDETWVLPENTISELKASSTPDLPSSFQASKTSSLFFSTSGTSGNPKIVVLQDSDLVTQAPRHIQSENERFACIANIEQNFSKRHRLYCLAMGATNVFLDKELDLVEQCHSLEVNVLHLSVFQAQELLAHPKCAELSHIRLKLGGSNVSPSMRKQLRECITPKLQAGYGTTETGAIAFTDPDDVRDMESVGKALPGLEIQIVSPDGTPLGVGEKGEVAIHGEGMFQAYLKLPEMTAQRLKDGWFYTGDIGYLDKQQRLYLSGRADDMFVFNSMNIFPQDLESKIISHPDVLDVAVIPKESPIHGNIPVALIVHAKGSEAELTELENYCQHELGLRSPRHFICVEEIPRNKTGKIARAHASLLGINKEQVRKTLIHSLNRELKGQLKFPSLNALELGKSDISLDELNLSSLSRMNLLVALETTYDLIITPKEFSKFHSLDDIVSFVVKRTAEIAQSQQTLQQVKQTKPRIELDSEAPYSVRFFARVFNNCDTVAELNKAILSFDNRFTPKEAFELIGWFENEKLLPQKSDDKFSTTVRDWLLLLHSQLKHCNKEQPELFQRKKVLPTVWYFSGPNSTSEKTLIICFAARGGKRIIGGHTEATVSNSIFMQYCDASKYDLLLITEPLRASYDAGVPYLGGNVLSVCRSLSKIELVNQYRNLRILGESAGAFPAIVAGYMLNAELSICISGIFHRRRKHPFKFFKRVLLIYIARILGSPGKILYCYSINKNRDRKFAEVLSNMAAGNKIAVRVPEKKLGHIFVKHLSRNGYLNEFFEQTVFSSMQSKLVNEDKSDVVMNFPEFSITPYEKEQ